MSLIVETTGLESIRDFLKKLPENLFKKAKNIFAAAVFDADNEVKDNFKGGQGLNVRTDMLRRSIQVEVAGADLKHLKAAIFSAGTVQGNEIVYAKIHEFGGKIKAKNKYMKVPGGPYLNIPTSANKTPAGVMRMPAREVFKAGGRVVKFRSGKYGVTLNGQMMFTLHKEVTIKQRLGLIKAAENQVPTILSNLANLLEDEQ